MKKKIKFNIFIFQLSIDKDPVIWFLFFSVFVNQGTKGVKLVILFI